MKGTTAVAVALLLCLLAISIPANASKGTSSSVITIYQSPNIIKESDSLTVYMEFTSTANIQQVYFTFCQIYPKNLCYTPISMVPYGTNWFKGTTETMASYPGMSIGAKAGYNITIEYTDNTTANEPSMPNQFGNMTVVQTLTGENVFEMVVSNWVYSVSGNVYISGTATGIAGATVTLSTSPAQEYTTSSTGAYSSAGVANGTYTITASIAGYVANSSIVTISGQDVSKDIYLLVSGPAIYTLTGHVYIAGTTTGVSGATVTLSPGDLTSTTDATGAYSFGGVANGTYMITVTEGGYQAGTATVTVSGQSAVQDISLTHSSGGGGTWGFLTTTIGIVIEVLVAAVVVGLVAYSISRRRKRNSQVRTQDPEQQSSPPST